MISNNKHPYAECEIFHFRVNLISGAYNAHQKARQCSLLLVTTLKRGLRINKLIWSASLLVFN